MYNVLLSYPRSANSWIRYAVEFVSKKPTTNSKQLYHQKEAVKGDSIVTMGDFGVDASAPAIMLKRHDANLAHDSWNKDDRFVFVIRDYRECILRNVAQRTEQKITNAVEMFVGNLEFFDKFEGDKLLIYYEDLMQSPTANMDKIFAFLGIANGPRYRNFLTNIKQHRVNGINFYHARAATQGAVNKLSFHAANASKQVVSMVDVKIRSRCPRHLYNKYLGRYRPF